jgi:pyrimidine-nucleoside phosphorylase
MVIPRLIERKRDGEPLLDQEWQWIVSAYARGEMPDYQMAALAMAVVFRGMSTAELGAVTAAMLHSGDSMPRSAHNRQPRIDKHSTGGVGDKTSLLLAPLLAACGVSVPMMSGRGLGHTGGTLDKLESIPGFRTNLTLSEAAAQLDEIGAVMLGPTAEVAPADRKLYALRDVTGTVPSIPLISASIMSKKLAESLDGLVLDVKTGSGAFLPQAEQSAELARTMIALGEASGCRTVALITAMDRPLGRTCGNALEVAEATAGLQGNGPADLMELTMALAVEMLLLGGRNDPEIARRELIAAIDSGAALDKWREMIAAQGGDARIIDDPTRLPTAPLRQEFSAPNDGYLAAFDVRALGHAVIALGGGRAQVTDPIDPAVGIEVLAQLGKAVTRGEPLVTIHGRDSDTIAAASKLLEQAINITAESPAAVPPLLQWRVTNAGAQPIGAMR